MFYKKLYTKYYFDNAATTKIDELVLDEMLPYYNTYYGNASTLYSLGQQAKQESIYVREKIASLLNCKREEIFFTSGGTESDNWAIKIAVSQNESIKKKHIITSAFEHKAILNTLDAYKKEGKIDVTYLPVYEDGIIKTSDLQKAIQNNTVLVTVMAVNNEIGTIQPINEIGRICKDQGVMFHCDAVQAIGNIRIDVKDLNIDMLSLSAHKIHGPKGIGALYIKNDIRKVPLIYGGGQESGYRSGTENIPAIIGFGKAMELSEKRLDQKSDKLCKYQKFIINALQEIDCIEINGSTKQRVFSNINFSIHDVDVRDLIDIMDEKYGIALSSISACGCRNFEPSHVLLSIGKDELSSMNSIRISMSWYTTFEEVVLLTEALKNTISECRKNGD